MPSGRPPGSANAGSVATELLIAIATVGLVGATALGSLGTELGASIADGARPNARASVSVAAGKVESDSPRRTCSGISFCQVARAADWLWDKSGLDSVVEAELDGAFWRTRESAGKPL
ncbi:MAG: hypothetical protein KC417_06125, partial [Myxococcales bacterium]|nr:hypothetical protein [Myxococcales bacterium]